MSQNASNQRGRRKPAMTKAEFEEWFGREVAIGCGLIAEKGAVDAVPGGEGTPIPTVPGRDERLSGQADAEAMPGVRDGRDEVEKNP